MGRLHEGFRFQASACGRLGSPMYEQLLHRIAQALGSTGPIDRVLAGHEDMPGRAALALRLLGSVHRLVLDGDAPGLAGCYPSVGGQWDLDAAWPALLDLLDREVDAVRAGLLVPPQTNEVGRSAALVGALLRTAATTRPVRLYELGASAGLNLRGDHYRYDGKGGAWGPADSPVLLADAWEGVATPVERGLTVVERVGCDSSPIDPQTPDGGLLLMSYVWPDQPARLARLRGALDVAARVPAEVRRQRAQDLAAGLELQPGTCAVVWHSVMWQYVEPDEQAVVQQHLRRLAAEASDEAPFVHVRLEPERRRPDAETEFLVVAEQWPPLDPGAPGSMVLGAAAPHGPPVTWER